MANIFPRVIVLRVLLLVFVLIAGCTNQSQEPEFTWERSPGEDVEPNTLLVREASNGAVAGEIDLRVDPEVIPLDHVVEHPEWLSVLEKSDGGTVWGVASSGGSWITFETHRDSLSNVHRSEFLLPEIVEQPYVVESENGDFRLVRKPNLDLETQWTLDQFNNQPDGITVIEDDNPTDLLVAYADPTERYPHGALGDRVEWSSLVVGPIEGGRVPGRYFLNDDEVFEGLFPLVSDLNGDGMPEIVTTVSNAKSGARVVVFSYEDDQLEILAESAPVGSGFRWLHQIAVAQFTAKGVSEIAVVQTPHIGGVAKFFRLVGDRLELVASNSGGYMSHRNGSRNLDQAVAGDFDQDGKIELLVPSRDQKSLIALKRVGHGVDEAWVIDLGSRLATNIVAVEVGGALQVAMVTQNSELLIWR